MDLFVVTTIGFFRLPAPDAGPKRDLTTLSRRVVCAHSPGRTRGSAFAANGFSRARHNLYRSCATRTLTPMPCSSNNNGTGWHLSLNSLFAGRGA
jgi:hypothetical protein